MQQLCSESGMFGSRQRCKQGDAVLVLPFGVWVRMDKYAAAPFRDRLAEHANTIGARGLAQESSHG